VRSRERRVEHGELAIAFDQRRVHSQTVTGTGSTVRRVPAGQRNRRASTATPT
jgi:hypothetical protein